MLPQGGLLNLYGKPKAGKSFGALGMALAIADPSVEFWVDKDFAVMQHGPVMYLQCDTPRGEWVRRVEDILKVHPYDVDEVWWADTLQTPYPFDILNPKHLEWLKASAERCHPVAVFVDTLREIHSGEEDSSTVMRNVIANLVSAVRPAALVLVSHTRKSNPNFEDDLMEGARGSSYVAGRMDVIAKLTGKQLILKGGATGEEKRAVTQEAGTGLIVLAKTDYEAERDETMKDMLFHEGSDADKVRLLHLMYPNVTPGSFKGKLSRLKKELGHKLPEVDKSVMKYSHEDIAKFIAQVEKGTDPFTGELLGKKPAE
jgi:hypothetical protein